MLCATDPFMIDTQQKLQQPYSQNNTQWFPAHGCLDNLGLAASASLPRRGFGLEVGA